MEVEAAVLPPPKVKPEEVVAVEVGTLPKREPVAGAVLPNIDPAAGAAEMLRNIHLSFQCAIPYRFLDASVGNASL